MLPGGTGGAVTLMAVRALFPQQRDLTAILADDTDTDLNLFTSIDLNAWLQFSSK